MPPNSSPSPPIGSVSVSSRLAGFPAVSITSLSAWTLELLEAVGEFRHFLEKGQRFLQIAVMETSISAKKSFPQSGLLRRPDQSFWILRACMPIIIETSLLLQEGSSMFFFVSRVSKQYRSASGCRGAKSELDRMASPWACWRRVSRGNVSLRAPHGSTC